MDVETLAGRIDHTVLGPTSEPQDVDRAVEEATTYGMNVCVPPCYVPRARERGGRDLTVVTVVGFPHGNVAPSTKRAEATTAVADGADELDMVLNVGWLLAGAHAEVRADIAGVVEAVDVPVKVIVEAGLLDETKLRTAGRLAAAADADYLKTSTGFAGGPARVDDVAVLAEYLRVKASGGIGDYPAAATMFSAGAERIGASSGVAIVEDRTD